LILPPGSLLPVALLPAFCAPCVPWPCSQLMYNHDNLTVAWHLNETFLGQDSSYKKVSEHKTPARQCISSYSTVQYSTVLLFLAVGCGGCAGRWFATLGLRFESLCGVV